MVLKVSKLEALRALKDSKLKLATETTLVLLITVIQLGWAQRTKINIIQYFQTFKLLDTPNKSSFNPALRNLK